MMRGLARRKVVYASACNNDVSVLSKQTDATHGENKYACKHATIP